MKEPKSKPKEKISKDDPRYFDQRTVQTGKDMQKYFIAKVVIVVIVVLLAFVIQTFI